VSAERSHESTRRPDDAEGDSREGSQPAAEPASNPGPEASRTSSKEGQKPGAKLGIVGTLALVVVAFAVMVWLTSDPGRREAVEDLVQSPMGLAVLFGLAVLSSATLILPAPGLALTAVAGSAGEPILVGIVAGLGQAIGELTGYAAGRNGRSFLPDSPAATRIAGWLERWGMALIFVLALIPNPVFDIAGIAAGALKMPVLRYLGAAAAGKMLKNIVVAGGAASLGGLLGAVGGLMPG
jgi:uncharacterized membrane protein YdjX (TVP38/TMEM64 family)